MPMIHRFTSTLFVLFLCASAFAKLPPTHDQVVSADPAAVATATPLLALIDAGSYKSAYRTFAPRVRRGGDVGEQQYVAYLKTRRASLGRTVSRTLSRARFSRTISGGPDGAYEFLDYETVFAHKAHAVEVVTLTKESGHWQVSGYHVY